MMRLILLGFTIPLALTIIGGCPQTTTDNTTDPESMTPRASAPTAADKGDTVNLTAQVGDDLDLTSVTVAWFQLVGRMVELTGDNTLSASFVAPSVPVAQTLRFRVDVLAADGTVFSDTIEVAIAADPDYGLDDSVSEDDEEDPWPEIRLVTSMGNITVRLNRGKAPLSVNNFLRYVDDDAYDDTIFHRVIADFVVQGGGYNSDLEQIDTRSPIRNEADNGLKNDRGTIAMARTNVYDSATSQFYINLVDNDSLNYTSGATGYAVFGVVIDGMDIVDEIAAVTTESRSGMSDVPVEDVILERSERIESDTISSSN